MKKEDINREDNSAKIKRIRPKVLCGISGQLVETRLLKRHFERHHENELPFYITKNDEPRDRNFKYNYAKFQKRNRQDRGQPNRPFLSEYDANSQRPDPKRQRMDIQIESNYESESMSDSSYPALDKNDSDNNESQPEKFATNQNLNFKTPDKNAITIMGEIMICNQNPAKLDTIIMNYASKFCSLDLLKIAALNQGSWLTDALKKIRPSDKISVTERTGIISLMTILGHQVLEQIPDFLPSQASPIYSKVLDEYNKVLRSFYKSEKIRDWFQDNIKTLKQRNLSAAKYFEKILHAHKYELMQMGNICEIPTEQSDLEHFMRLCQKIIKADKHTWISDCLKRIPRQQCLNLNEFHTMASELTLEKNASVLESQKDCLIQNPIFKWRNIIEELMKEISGTIGEQNDFEETLKLLIKEFGLVDRKVLRELFQDQNSLINKLLKSTQSAPNDHQTCIAAYAVLRLGATPAQIWDLIGGMGKSRVIATMGLMLLLFSGYKRVHFVYPSESLKAREQEEFEDYWAKSGTSDSVTYHANLTFKMAEGEIIINDEADHLMFTDPKEFFDKASSYPMISITASMPLTSTKSLEQHVMDHMKLTKFSYSKIQCVNKFEFDEKIDEKDDQKLAHLLLKMSEDQAILAYCNDGIANAIRAATDNSTEITGQTDYKFIRQLDSKHISGKYNLLYTTDQATMRGLDFRAPTNGISLVIARSFVTERDFHQAMVRVGRHGDKCKRYCVAGVQGIDTNSNNALQAKMFKFLSGRQPIQQSMIKQPMIEPNSQPSLRIKKMMQTEKELTGITPLSQYFQKKK